MAESVKITLSLNNPESQDMPFPRRELVLDREKKSIIIGRASKAETKGLVSLPNNAWFFSPVMSRQHAEIVANLDEKKVTVKDLDSLHGTYVNGSKEKLEKDELHELRDGDKLQLGLSIYRGLDAFPPTTLNVNIEYREKKTDAPAATFQVPDCSDVEEDYSSDSNSDVLELTQLRPVTPTFPIPKIGSTASNVIDLTQLPARDMHHYQVIDLSSPPHSPLSIVDDDDSNDVVELSDVGSPLPDQAPSPDTSSRVASPDLSTTSPNISATSPEITSRNEEFSPLVGPTEVCNDNDSSSGYESSYHGSGYDDTDGDEELDDDGFPFGENESSDGEASDQDSLDDEVALSSPGIFNVDDECILRSDSEENDDSEDLHEDPDFDDYSSEDEASDYGAFPDEDLERVLASISQRSNINMAPKGLQTLMGESREGPDATQRPSSDISGPSAYPTDPDFCVAPSDSVSNGVRSIGAVAINTLLNAEKTPHHDEVGLMEPGFPVPPTAIFTARETAREPSPSDAVMPKSLHPLQAEKPRNESQLLAERLGKVEYFAAREENKILAAKFQRAPEPRSSVYSLCNTFSHGRGPFSLDTTSTMGQFLKKHNGDPDPEPLVQLPDVNWTEPVPEPTRSQEKAPTGEPAAGATTSLSEIDSTIKDADDQSLRRTHVGILDIVETYQPTPVQAAQSEEMKDVRVKRKADDISDSTTREEEWAQHADLERVNPENEIVVPQSRQISPPAQGSTTGSPAPRMVMSQEVDVRPTKKLRLFAEKLGYAALGGVTAGAMIFGTLVYTAPTFV